MIPSWVEPLIGIPFKDRGRTREGLDCWGLCRLVLTEQYGVRNIPSYDSRYEKAGDRVAVARLFFTETTSARWRRLPLNEATPPDVLSMYIAGNSHAAILVTPDRFLHVLPGRETCVERLAQWASRVDGVYRHEELALVSAR